MAVRSRQDSTGVPLKSGLERSLRNELLDLVTQQQIGLHQLVLANSNDRDLAARVL
jgi:hypothetical protein